MSASDTIGHRQRRGRTALAGGALSLLALGAWALGYATGAFPWIGYAWQKRASWGFDPPFSIVGSKGYGTSLGLTYFPFFKGQEIVVSYDVEIAEGCLWFYVFRPFVPGTGDGVSHWVGASGAGEWTMRVPDSGIYAIAIKPMPRGRGYDLAYSASWGARPAR